MWLIERVGYDWMEPMFGQHVYIRPAGFAHTRDEAIAWIEKQPQRYERFGDDWYPYYQIREVPHIGAESTSGEAEIVGSNEPSDLASAYSMKAAAHVREPVDPQTIAAINAMGKTAADNIRNDLEAWALKQVESEMDET